MLWCDPEWFRFKSYRIKPGRANTQSRPEIDLDRPGPLKVGRIDFSPREAPYEDRLPKKALGIPTEK